MSGKKTTARVTSGKRQFLVHIDNDLIHRIKIMAIEQNVSASSVVQEALLAWLAANSPSPRKPGDRS